MIAIIDYDAGNIRSVEKAVQALGGDTVLTNDASVIRRAGHVILPGVGSFGSAMENLYRFDLADVIRETVREGKPFLGICLGLQLLFERSEESPGAEGLGILKGEILRIPEGEGRKIPHMGWNSLHLKNSGRLFDGVPEGAFVYFVHSYYLHAEDPSIVRAETEYGVTIHASVEQDNVMAAQFHPEKSSSVGRQILQNFLSLR